VSLSGRQCRKLPLTSPAKPYILPLSRGNSVRSLELYYAQLGLNLVWSPLFFLFHRKGLALVDILALTGTTAWWTKTLFDLGPISIGNFNFNPGWLAVPYMAWLSVGESRSSSRTRILVKALNNTFWDSYIRQPGIPRAEPG
jgi:tryptophan-rich sensory protein